MCPVKQAQYLKSRSLVLKAMERCLRSFDQYDRFRLRGTIVSREELLERVVCYKITNKCSELVLYNIWDLCGFLKIDCREEWLYFDY